MLFLALLSHGSHSFGVTLYKQLKQPVIEDSASISPLKIVRNARKALTVVSGDTYKSSTQYIPTSKSTTYTFPMQLSPSTPISTTGTKSTQAPSTIYQKSLTTTTGTNEMVLIPKTEYEKYREMSRTNPKLNNSVDNGGEVDKFMNLVNSGVNRIGNIGLGLLNTSTEIVDNGMSVQQDLMSKMAQTQTQNYEALLKNQLAMQEMEKNVTNKRTELDAKSGTNSSKQSYFTNTYATGFLKKELI